MMVENNGGITNKTRIFGKKIHHLQVDFFGILMDFEWEFGGGIGWMELLGWLPKC